MLSERKLRKWRIIALEVQNNNYLELTKILAGFILELTQELLDQRLLSKSKEIKWKDQKELV